MTRAMWVVDSHEAANELQGYVRGQQEVAPSLLLYGLRLRDLLRGARSL